MRLRGARILAGARFVIRYDHRDAGRSVTCPPRRPGSIVAGLVADAPGVLVACQPDGLNTASPGSYRAEAPQAARFGECPRARA